MRETTPICLPLCALLCAGLLLAPHSAEALASPWQRDQDAGVRLIAGVDGTGEAPSVPLGLEIDLAPGWHTYWRSPGMAGLPPQVDWSAGTTPVGNLASATLHYPAPGRYSAYGLETIGYRGHVILPIDAVLRVPGQALNLDAQATLLLCSSVCVPKTLHLSLTVPAGPATPGAEAAALHAAQAQVPQATDAAGLRVVSVKTTGRDVIVTAASDRPLAAPDVFVEAADDIPFGAPIVALADDRHATFTLTPADALPAGKKLAGLQLTLTIVSGTDAIEVPVTVPQPADSAAPGAPVELSPAAVTAGTTATDVAPAVSPAVTPEGKHPLTLLLALLSALAGGLILNLMPCVLPVLSLKILSVARHGGGERRRIRRSFLASAGGIMASFLALALMTVALKELGLSVGWGLQFQQPVFLTGLIVLLTLFAANMWGFFEVPLPRFLADNLDARVAARSGSDRPYRPRLTGDFATGALATLLATPCTAPFLGTAVGFALTAGPMTILLIFAALGLGMSLPYLAVAAMPAVAAALPRPGHWMRRLRQLLGVALALTAAWLLWVLMMQVILICAVTVGACMLALVGLLALPRGSLRRGWRRGAILWFVTLALGVTVSGELSMPPAAAPDGHWQRFSAAVLAQDIAAGQTVFVDVTASWCLTCKANAKFVLRQPDIQQRLFGGDVVALQADWTSPDPAITSFLHRFGRYGVPFNVVFGPGAPQGIALPELLNHDAVVAALDRAAHRP